MTQVEAKPYQMDIENQLRPEQQPQCNQCIEMTLGVCGIMLVVFAIMLMFYFFSTRVIGLKEII